jgi:hypothetical protein
MKLMPPCRYSDILGTVARHFRESQLVEQGFQYAGAGRSEFDELESAQAHGVIEKVRHACLLPSKVGH